MRKLFANSFLAELLIILYCTIALWSLARSGFYTSHDGFTHTARIAAYYDSMRDGQFPAKWAKNLNGNLGSPIFIYSYPLVYMIGAGLHFLGVKYEDTFRMIMGGGFIFSGLAMYWWLKSRFGSLPGSVGAVIYLWTPYHLLNVYVRGALAENFAYIFLPLILLGIDRTFLAKTKIKWWLLMVVSTVGMLLSHNVVSAMFLPVAFLWTVLLYLETKNRKAVTLVAVGLILAFLSSGFIYFPDLFERAFIRFDQGISYWKDHFVFFSQFMRSRWDYGFDLPGYINDAMSFELGLANWLTLGLLTLVLLFKRKADKFLVFFLFLFMFVLLVSISNPASISIWQNFPLMKTIIDFPWRWFGLLALIMGYFGAYLIKNSLKFLAVILLLAVLISNRNHLRVNQVVTFGDATFDKYTGTATATSDEYTPKWHNSLHFPIYSSRVEKINGDLTVTSGRFTADSQDFKVDAITSGGVRVNRFYFPQTTIYRNGKKLEMGRDWVINDGGTINLSVVPPGGNFLLLQSEADLRKMADYLSLFAFISIGGIFYVARKI